VGWVVLKEHVNDTSLNAKGASHTWSITLDPAHLAQLAAAAAEAGGGDNNSGGNGWDSASAADGSSFPPPLAFRCFRVVMTAANSNGHMYLPLSGLEIYGVLHAASAEHLTSPPALSAVQLNAWNAASINQNAAAAAASAGAANVGAPQNAPVPAPTPVASAPPLSALKRAPSAAEPHGLVSLPLEPACVLQVHVLRCALVVWVLCCVVCCAVHRPVSDFDENGILYHLATAARTKPWVNPCTSVAAAFQPLSVLSHCVAVLCVM
jgi:hypothetical protein